MKKNIKKIFIIIIMFILSLHLFACNVNNKPNGPENNDPTNGPSNEGPTNNDPTNNDPTDNDPTNGPDPLNPSDVNTLAHNFKLVSSDDGVYKFNCEDSDCEEVREVKITVNSGTSNYEVSDTTITFKEISEKTSVSISGTFYGNILIDVSDNYQFELSLEGLELTSEVEVPIYIKSADKCVISAKKSTVNVINDIRKAQSEDGTSASIYSKTDLDIQGKGKLELTSLYNNGIHSKDDLSLKNLTLSINVKDNALKGNDGVEIQSGSYTLIAREGDAIKTTNSHLSSKGKQKGDITINGGTLNIYAACDGLDASHDVIISEDNESVNINIFTDKYSEYSEEVTNVSESNLYIKYSSAQYKYSICFKNGENETWVNSSSYKQANNAYYYSFKKVEGADKLIVYVYDSTMEQGQSNNYLAKSDNLSINNSYDTISLSYRRNAFSFSWTNYQTQPNQGSFGGYPGGKPGGQGGMQDGNTNKGDYSTKGIKADNEITIKAGTINIKSYDDALHTNSDVQLGEEGAYYYGTGNIYINGGNITIYSNDDGIHADGILYVNGGDIKVNNSYEGFEGSQIEINDGIIYIKSSDDGMNATTTSGFGITINGGTIYVYASGDGLDANTRTSYEGLIFNGGYTFVISTGSNDSSLDTEQGYTYNAGYVVAVSRSGGMSNESTKCKNFSTVGESKTLSLTANNYLVVDKIASIKVPYSVSALVVVLGSNNANVSTTSSDNGYTYDSNNVCWLNK